MEQQNNKKPEGNIHPDNSVLSRNSLLYRPEDTRTTREKLKSMKFTDKVVFIVQYYGLKILAVIAAIALVIYLIVHFAFAKEVVLNIMAVNAQDIATTSAAADEQSFYEDFLKTHVENTDDVEVGIASNVSVSEDESNSAGMQNLQAIQVQLMAGTVDDVLADEAFATSLGEMGYLADITTILPQDVLDKYADDIVYATSVDTNETAPVGIRLKDNAWLKKSGWYANVENPVIGVSAAADHADLAVDFMLYVLDEAQ